jgi:hypothetical protein
MPTTAMTDTRAIPTNQVSLGTPRSTQHSAFLNLPVELRDEIYSHVATDDPTSSRIVFDAQPHGADGRSASGHRGFARIRRLISRTTSQPDTVTPIEHHSLLYACKQLRREYTRALLRYPGITATIHNFDFQPFMAFLSRLPSSYLALLPKQSTPLGFQTSEANYTTTEADVHLLLDMPDDDDDVQAALEGLERWWTKQKSLEVSRSRLRVSYRFTKRPGPVELDLHLHFCCGLTEPPLWPLADVEGTNNEVAEWEALGMHRALLKSETYPEGSGDAGMVFHMLRNSERHWRVICSGM